MPQQPLATTMPALVATLPHIIQLGALVTLDIMVTFIFKKIAKLRQVVPEANSMGMSRNVFVVYLTTNWTSATAETALQQLTIRTRLLQQQPRTERRARKKVWFSTAMTTM